MQGKSLPIARNLVLGTLIALIVFAIFLPVYTDEVGWRFQERAAIDGMDKMYADGCGANALAVPPFFMMPVRYYSALFNTLFANPFYIRVSGILYALTWLALVLALIRQLGATTRTRSALGIICFSLVSMGMIPFLLVLSRPEQPILIAITASILIALHRREAFAKSGSAVPLSRAIIEPSGILVLAVIAFSYHLKGVVLAPAFLLCLVCAGSGLTALRFRIVLGAALCAAAGVSAKYWFDRLACPDDPVLAAQYAQQSIGGMLFSGATFGDILPTLMRNANPVHYILLIAPTENPMSAWVPPVRPYGNYNIFIGILGPLTWGIVSFFGLAALITQTVISVAKREFCFRILIAILLFGCTISWSSTLTVRNIYELSLIMPMYILTFLLIMADLPRRNISQKIERFALTLLAIVGVLNLVGTARLYGPTLLQTRYARGYIDQQPYSVPVFGYDEMKPQIEKAARLCGIVPGRRLQNLLIDDLTYFTFMQSHTPQHRLGLIGHWNGSINDPVAYLKAKGSDGAVLGCRYLPPDLRVRAKRVGDVCCLGPPGW